MSQAAERSKKTWENSFEEQIARGAYNTSPVEALARTVAYHLRANYSDEQRGSLDFMEMGCGAGPNLVWLAEKGIKVHGADISTNALELCRENLKRRGLSDRVGELVECGVEKLPFKDESFDGILEACVFQHLEKEQRNQAFSEVVRLLKPGGVFVGNMLDRGHTVYQANKDKEDSNDPGTIHMDGGGSKLYIQNIGLNHFFAKEEYLEAFKGFSIVDPHLMTYHLPQHEAQRRGYEDYLQSMWIVYAVK